MLPYILFNYPGGKPSVKTQGHENCIQQFAKNERNHFC